MPIAALGAVNVSALQVPQALVQIVPPQFLFNGVPTNIGGFVGTAPWGPTNSPKIFSNYAQYTQIYGPTVSRNFDMGGHVILAQMQGAGYFVGVRVTDTTDVAATIAVPAGLSASGTWTWVATQPVNNSTITIGTTTITFVTGTPSGNQIKIGATLGATLLNAVTFLNASLDAQIVQASYTLSGVVITATFKVQGTGGNSFAIAASSSPASNATASAATLLGGTAPATGFTATAKYTGTFGNGIKVIFQTGSQASTIKAIITAPGMNAEVFDNIGTGLTANALWIAIVSAINNGNASIRPPSSLIVATVGASTAAPVLNVATQLAGGTDGASAITTAMMLGIDAQPRTGMYALRNTYCARFDLCDLSDAASWSTQIAFAIDVGAEAISCTAASDTISVAATELSNSGIDDYNIKVIFGDWIIWNDTVTGTPQRLTSPQSVCMGIRGNLSPQNSTLNKPINGIIGTQQSLLGKIYGYAEFQAIKIARMDIVALDTTITNNFIFRLGCNTSSNSVISDDSYTDLINFFAKNISIIAAHYLGQTITPDQMRQAKIAFDTNFELARVNGLIGQLDGSQPYQTVLNLTNNTQQTAALGYEFAYCKLVFFGILKFFIINLEGGASVTISNTPPGQ